MAKKVFVEQTKLFVTFEDLTTMHSKDSILVSADVFFEVYPSIQKSPIVPVEEKVKIKEIYSSKAKLHYLKPVTPDDTIRLSVAEAILFFKYSKASLPSSTFRKVPEVYSRKCYSYEWEN